MFSKVIIPPCCSLGVHEHHGNTETYHTLSGTALYNDNGVTREIGPGDSTWTPDGTGHGVDNSAGTEPIVFMALIVNK